MLMPYKVCYVKCQIGDYLGRVELIMIESASSSIQSIG